MMWKARRAWVALGMVNLLVWSGSARAADGPVANMPWLHEGLEISDSWVTLAVAGTNYVEDKDGKWHIGGKNYSELDESQGVNSTGGIRETTVAGLTGDWAILSAQNFCGVIAKGVPPPYPQMPSGLVVANKANPDMWIDPTVLAHAQSDADKQVTVTHIDWKLADGRTIPVVWEVSASNGYISRMYDAKTGLCVHFAVEGVGAETKYSHGIAGGITTLTHGDFLSQRDLNVPWGQDAPPGWITKQKALHYQGQTVPLRGYLPPPGNIRIDIAIDKAGDGWMAYTPTTSAVLRDGRLIPLGGAASACGRCQFNGLWAGPASLANLQVGQVLDQDPLTQANITVTGMDENSVTITQANSTGEQVRTYDRKSGLEIGGEMTDPITKTRTMYRLAGVE